MLIRTIACAALMLAGTQAALATMPRLTDLPASRTADSCQKWANGQDDEALEMWGLMESGKSSNDVGRLRLALSCLGDKPPEIVGFGSSAGATARYCRAHGQTQVCRDLR